MPTLPAIVHLRLRWEDGHRAAIIEGFRQIIRKRSRVPATRRIGRIVIIFEFGRTPMRRVRNVHCYGEGRVRLLEVRDIKDGGDEGVVPDVAP